MLVSELKPMEEILGYVDGEKKIFIIGCKGCAEACETGGEPQVLALARDLGDAGKEITGQTVADFLCDKALVKLTLNAHRAEVEAADSLVIMTCGVGVQATAAVVNKVTHPACNTINLGGVQGKWRGSERCAECGDCLLDMTGGICPVTMCTKSLMNGQCGGTKDGMCEVDGGQRPCGWHLIYERLKQLDKLDNLKKIQPPKAYSKMEPPPSLRSTIMWALENKEEEQQKDES